MPSSSRTTAWARGKAGAQPVHEQRPRGSARQPPSVEHRLEHMRGRWHAWQTARPAEAAAVRPALPTSGTKKRRSAQPLASSRSQHSLHSSMAAAGQIQAPDSPTRLQALYVGMSGPRKATAAPSGSRPAQPSAPCTGPASTGRPGTAASPPAGQAPPPLSLYEPAVVHVDVGVPAHQGDARLAGAGPARSAWQQWWGLK